MKALTLTLFLFSSLLSASEKSEIAYDYEAGMHAAYFGETEKLRKLIGSREDFNKNVTLNPPVLIGYAMAGGHKDTVKAILDYGWPRYGPELRDVFTNRHMRVDMVSVFAKNIPNFKERHGTQCLSYAIAAGREDIARALIELGVPVNDHRSPPLLAALKSRSQLLITLLIQNGADPYIGSKPQRPVDIAADIRSHSLLSKLDSKGEYSELLSELARYVASDDSPFPGLWAYRPQGGGFGTIALQLFQDGSGTMVGDIGVVPILWKGKSSDTIQIKPTSSFKQRVGERAKDMTISLTFTNGELTLTSKGGKRALKRENAGKERLTDWRYPIFVILEHTWITKEDDLIIQINRMRLRVPLSNIVKGAKQTRYHSEPTKLNVLRWKDFKEISEVPVPPNSRELPMAKRSVSPGYSRHWDRLGYNHKEMVTLADGIDQMVFKSHGKRYHGEDPSKYGQELNAWAIMRKGKFPHDRDWVLFFLLKSVENKHAQQDGADQPANAPESKPEGNEKPKPEPEGRSQ
jgi:hypothetical protein